VRKLPPVNEFDIAQIDDVIHGRVRLGVMAYITAADSAEFNTLKEKIGATDGTLSVHLRKLEEAGYIAIEKSFRNRRPLTTCRLTPEGRRAFKRYLDALGKLTGLSN
jgi:DNA-binding MarR family transcriptional regulator